MRFATELVLRRMCGSAKKGVTKEGTIVHCKRRDKGQRARKEGTIVHCKEEEKGPRGGQRLCLYRWRSACCHRHPTLKRQAHLIKPGLLGCQGTLAGLEGTL